MLCVKRFSVKFNVYTHMHVDLKKNRKKSTKVTSKTKKTFRKTLPLKCAMLTISRTILISIHFHEDMRVNTGESPYHVCGKMSLYINFKVPTHISTAWTIDIVRGMLPKILNFFS